VNAGESHRSYDLFKLLVALALLVIWIILMLRPAQLNPPAAVAPATAMTFTPGKTPTDLPQPSATLTSTSTATVQPSATRAPTSPATIALTATEAFTGSLTATPTSATAAVTETVAAPSPMPAATNNLNRS
jgi:cytoskeletal protein RodZ